MKLDTKQLKSLMTFVNYKIANSLIKYRKIKEFNLKQDNSFQLDGIVEQYKKNYNAHATVNLDGTIGDFSCDCDRHSKGEIVCSHVGALLVEFANLDSATKLPYHYVSNDNYKDRLLNMQRIFQEKAIIEQKSQSLKLISTYQEEILEATTKLDKNISIAPTIAISEDDHISVDYKIGSSRLYVIKSLPQFIENYNTKARIKYGKELITNHEKSDFSPLAIRQIDFIREATNINDMLTRYISIDDDNIDLFYHAYFDLENPYLKFVDKAPKVIKIKKENHGQYDKFTLHNVPGRIFFGHQHLYHLIEAKLYRYPLMASNALKSFIASILEEDIIVFNENKKDFGKYIIDRISPYVELIDDDYDEYLTDDVYVQVYADIDYDNNLRIDLKYIDENENEISDPMLTDYNLPIGVSSTQNLLSKDFEFDKSRNCFVLDKSYTATTDYIKKQLPRFKEFSEVFVSDAIESIQKNKSLALSVGVKLENNLLEINFDNLDIDQDEVIDILKAYRANRTFHRLNNGNVITLEDESIQAVNDLMEDLNIDLKMIQDNSITVDKSRAMYLNSLMDESKLAVKSRNEAFTDLVDGIKDVDPNKFFAPQKFQTILRNYQKDGFRWLKTLEHYGFNGILCDDMGLGKTLQVIALLEANKGQGKTSIVITPATLILNWKDEIEKFTDNLKVICIQGTAKARLEDIRTIKDYDVVLTSYDYIRRDSDLYQDIVFDYVILDEAQYIKNQKTKNAQEVKKIQGEHRLALTGTPIENSLAELWSLFDFLMPEYLFNYSYFKRNFETPIVKNNDQEITKRLQRMVEPFILRRTKSQVLKELPEKTENDIHIRFNDEEKKIYLANLVQVNNELQTMMAGEVFNKVKVLAMMTKLRQLCCDPRLVYQEFAEPSSKLEVCMNLIDNIQQENEKVLLFSSFTSVLSLVEEQLKERNISYYKLTGETSKSKRHQLVNNFQVDDTTVFLISLKAGGTGLNLTAASSVIHFDPWWNLSAQNQATDRAYRIGQKNKVQVYKLIMKDSIEEKIQNLQKQKHDLAQVFVENNDGSITAMNHQEIAELFKIDFN